MNFEFIKKKKWILLLVLLIVLVGSAAGYFYLSKHKKVDAKTESKKEAVYDLPIYTVLQDGTAKVIAYDYNLKKHYVLMSTLVSGDNPRFYADYSAVENSIVYSDNAGISLYDLKEKKTTKLLENKIPKEGEKETAVETYSSPKWSYDGKKIVYTTYGWEWQYFSIMDADGQNIQKIDNSGNFTWSKDSYDYVIASANEMGGEYGVSVNLADPINKTKQILPQDRLNDSFSPQIINQDDIYFISQKYPDGLDGKLKANISSIKRDGSNLTAILTDDQIQQSLVYDGSNNLYFSKATRATNTDETDKGLGVFEMSLDSKDSTLFYKDNDNIVTPIKANSDFVVVSSSPKLYWQEGTIGKLLLISKKDKTVFQMGEASNINFSSWIKSDALPQGLETIGAPTPTESEQKAYEISLKTKGYLYKSFYDYCWDYDCSNQSFPRTKLSQSKTPEIITLNEKPSVLTGNVRIPVVFMYDGTAIPDYQINTLKDENVANTFGAATKWLNDQAKANKQTLDFGFDYKTDPIDLAYDDSCIKSQGVSKYYSMDCVKNRIYDKYPDLKDANQVYIAFGADFTKEYNKDQNGSYSGNNRYSWEINNNIPKISIITFEINGSVWNQEKRASEYILKTEDSFKDAISKQWSGNFNAGQISAMLTAFGAKNKNEVSYLKPISESSAACIVDQKNDIMCRQYFNSGKVNYLYDLTSLVIGDVTKKELGWYDADNDGINEVSDTCPFDNTNTCKK